mmetsp:Transcript_9486/g.23375  ORF Transcript_9486/g.23375 Transcript_9486/m.23375 type:complete len:85 (-) Transcript_9486:260-514(-)
MCSMIIQSYILAYFTRGNLIEKTKDFTTSVLPTGLLMVHDTERCCENNESKVTRRKKVDDPLFYFRELDIEAWGNNTALVETTE